MTLDQWMPSWDARSRHHIEIQADPAAVFEVLRRTDFSRNPVLRVLMAIRILPALVVHPRRTWSQVRKSAPSRTSGPGARLLSGAFAELESIPPTELTLGLSGRFWTLTGGLIPTDRGAFGGPIPPGLARAVWNFQLSQVQPGRTRLTTETRIACADQQSRRSFLRYWRIIRGGSGVIRWALLRQVKLAAERAGSAPA